MEKTALLVIDVQQGLFERESPIYKEAKFLDILNSVIDRAREAGVPVIFIQHSNDSTLVRGSRSWKLHQDIQPLKSESIVNKRQGNAFAGTDLKEMLTSLGVKAVVTTGIATQWCVRATTLGALDLGYDVTVISDGHSNFSKGAKRLINKWNNTFSEKGASLILARDVEFSQE